MDGAKPAIGRALKRVCCSAFSSRDGERAGIRRAAAGRRSERGGQGVAAAKETTRSIPIVMGSTLDAVASGFVDSLARPGGNVTGLTLISTDLMGKRLELLREAFPPSRSPSPPRRPATAAG